MILVYIVAGSMYTESMGFIFMLRCYTCERCRWYAHESHMVVGDDRMLFSTHENYEDKAIIHTGLGQSLMTVASVTSAWLTPTL